MSDYPKSIVLQGDILEDFLQMSDFFKGIDRWEGHKSSYTLTAERLFDGDQNAWKLFLDIFFPDKVSQLKRLNNGTFSMVPVFNYDEYGNYTLTDRWYTMDYVKALFDFLMIPKEIEKDVYEYVKNLHFHRAKKPSPPFRNPPKVPSPSKENLEQYYNLLRNNHNFFRTFNVNEYYNNNETYEPNVELGFKNEEEEEAFGKLTRSNYSRYAPEGGKRRVRKTRKLKKKSH
jgi:hypothetical protein